LAPELTIYLLHALKHQENDGPANTYLEDIIERAISCGADGLDLGNSPLITRWFVDKMKMAGLEFHVWTVNSAEEALRYIELDVDSITTDRPQGLREEITALLESF
jgi:glycerophosphoryl diester phosphodiesterase